MIQALIVCLRQKWIIINVERNYKAVCGGAQEEKKLKLEVLGKEQHQIHLILEKIGSRDKAWNHGTRMECYVFRVFFL